MRVWVLQQGWFDDDEIVGVYANQADAEAEQERLIKISSPNRAQTGWGIILTDHEVIGLPVTTEQAKGGAT